MYKHHPSTIPDKNADLDTHLMSAVGAYWKESNGDTQQLVARVEEEVGNEVWCNELTMLSHQLNIHLEYLLLKDESCCWCSLQSF